MDNTTFKVYSSYLDDNSYFTLSKPSNLHVLCRSDGNLIFDDYVNVGITYNDFDAYFGVNIYWEEYENLIGGLFSNRHFQMKFYSEAEKLHIDGKSKYGPLINIIVSLPPRLRR